MLRKKLILKIIYSIIVLGLIITGFVMLAKREEAKDNGTITIELIDLENNVLSTKNHNYKVGDTLFKILDDNYDIEYENSVFGGYIIKIDSLHAPNKNELFIKILVNDEFSTVGVSQIKLENKLKVTFILTRVET